MSFDNELITMLTLIWLDFLLANWTSQCLIKGIVSIKFNLLFLGSANRPFCVNRIIYATFVQEYIIYRQETRNGLFCGIYFVTKPRRKKRISYECFRLHSTVTQRSENGEFVNFNEYWIRKKHTSTGRKIVYSINRSGRAFVNNAVRVRPYTRAVLRATYGSVADGFHCQNSNERSPAIRFRTLLYRDRKRVYCPVTGVRTSKSYKPSDGACSVCDSCTTWKPKGKR